MITKSAMMMSYASVGMCVMFVVGVHAICEDTPVLWRNNNITCPERAVCADLFVTNRDLPDGAQCEELRITHNCLCPGGLVCPYNQPAHALYASGQQQQFTCRPVCQLPFCPNIRNAVAQTSEQNAPNFGGKTYMRVSCRCPDHHEQYRESDSDRSVQVSGQRYNVKSQKYNTEYVCRTRVIDELIIDPCRS